MGEEKAGQPVEGLDIGDVFKDLVWGALVKLALQRLFVALPFLGWGPIGWIVGIVAGMVAEALYEVMREAVDLQVIAFRNSAARKEFDSAGVKLKIIARDHGIESPEFQEARDTYRDTLRKLVVFN